MVYHNHTLPDRTAGHFYLTKLLLPTLLATAAPRQPARVINTSSMASEVFGEAINYDTLKDSVARTKAGPNKLYYQSKFVSKIRAPSLFILTSAGQRRIQQRTISTLCRSGYCLRCSESREPQERTAAPSRWHDTVPDRTWAHQRFLSFSIQISAGIGTLSNAIRGPNTAVGGHHRRGCEIERKGWCLISCTCQSNSGANVFDSVPTPMGPNRQ
jgi:hypothetical protein